MCLVDSSVKRLEVRTQISEMSILSPQEKPRMERRKAKLGAEFDSAWLANDHTGSERWGELWGQREDRLAAKRMVGLSVIGTAGGRGGLERM